MVQIHASDDELEEMCLGIADAEALARLAAHVSKCVACAERLAEIREYIQTMQSALATLLPGSKHCRLVH